MTLTRDEIFSMTPDRLRVEIAKRRGIDVLYPFDGRYGPFCQTGLTGEGNPHLSVLPDWTTSIADAWELVEDAQAEQYQQTFEIGHTPAISKRWFVIIGTHRSVGDTASLAICRAWLLWHEERKEEK